MNTKIFKPLVLVIHHQTGLANMWTREFYERAERPSRWVVAYADTPEEAAKLWALKDKTNAVRRGQAWNADA